MNRAQLFAPFAFMFVVVSCLLLARTSIMVATVGILPDFRVYHRAAGLVVQRVSPYQANIEFIYPPSSLPILVFLSAMPVELAEVVWTVLSVGMLVLVCAVVALSAKEYGYDQTLWMWIFLGIAAWQFPVKFTLGMGQINFFVLAAVVTGWYLIGKGHTVWGGVLVGVAASLKLLPLLYCLPLCKKREWSTILVILLSFLSLHIPTILWLGYEVVPEFYGSALFGIPTLGNAVYYNQALSGLLARLVVPLTIARILNGSALVLFLSVAWLVTSSQQRIKGYEWLEWGVWQVALLLVGGLAWQHHIVWTLPVLYASLLVAQNNTQKILILAIVFSLLGWNFSHPTQHAWPFLSSHGTIGLLILYGYVAFTLFKNRERKTALVTTL